MKKRINFKEGQGVRLIPLGGLNEIGKNITVLEYKKDIIIIDCGLSFPDDEMFGIDIVIPDFEYLEENRDRIKGLVLTHGHEDHIGAIPYLMQNVKVPIYGTKLTLELVKSKLKEHGIKAKTNIIKPGNSFKVGEFKILPIRVTHSIADSVALAIDTPVGTIFHTGDFKIDYTPLHGEPMDFHSIAKVGEKGVLLMLSDSTNAERPGFTPPEANVGRTLEQIFRNSDGRIIIATFSSNVHRVQMIIDTAVMFKKKVAISGRSMINVVEIARDIGYLKIPDGVLVDINQIKNIKDKELVIITTGSQGEPMSALARMANNDHKAVQIKKGDKVILSSTPVPGNEKTVSNVVNKLFQRGADVIYSEIFDIHVSGHASEEELKLMHSLVKPKYFMPVHGEYRHLRRHGMIAESLGTPKDNIFILTNGETLILKKNQVQMGQEEITCDPVFVDGLGVGDVGNIVLRDRKLLSESGLIIVVTGMDFNTGHIFSGPEIISRGFVYVKESEDLMEAARKTVMNSLNKCTFDKTCKDKEAMKGIVRKELANFIYQKTKRNPVILPIFMEV